MLTISGLEKSYPAPDGPIPVLAGVDLELAAGASLALMGESGSGKSTLLHLAAGLDTPDGGSITLDGTTISALGDAGRARLRRGAIGIVFQQFNLVPSLTVADNLALQARLAGRVDERWIAELGERLGLSALLDRYPERLSGGQQQRVAIGRALAPRPRLVLADEPTGNLDEATAEAVITLFLDLVAASGCAFVMATHSPRLATRLARKVTVSRGRLA